MRQKIINDEPAEILASSIKEIADGVKKLRASGLNDECLILLISESAKVGKKTVKRVLDAMETLGATYLKPAE